MSQIRLLLQYLLLVILFSAPICLADNDLGEVLLPPRGTGGGGLAPTGADYSIGRVAARLIKNVLA